VYELLESPNGEKTILPTVSQVLSLGVEKEQNLIFSILTRQIKSKEKISLQKNNKTNKLKENKQRNEKLKQTKQNDILAE
jgi:hypothetical protein